tara:strand:- start:55 stop:927 length:873 start_codon:yes stop_codon:yes gene_type:complete
MLSFNEVQQRKKEELKRKGKPNSGKFGTRWCEHNVDWTTCTFPRRGYVMEKGSKWRSKTDTGLKFYVRKITSEWCEKGAIMIKDRTKWHSWQLTALNIMYPKCKDVMPVLIKKHLDDWGIPSSPLQRCDMKNEQAAFINHLIHIHTFENEQPSFERIDSSTVSDEQASFITELVAPSGGETKSDIDKNSRNNEPTIKTLLDKYESIVSNIHCLNQKVAIEKEKASKIKEEITKKQINEKRRERRREKKIMELEAKIKILKGCPISSTSFDSSDDDEESSIAFKEDYEPEE